MLTFDIWKEREPLDLGRTQRWTCFCTVTVKTEDVCGTGTGTYINNIMYKSTRRWCVAVDKFWKLQQKSLQRGRTHLGIKRQWNRGFYHMNKRYIYLFILCKFGFGARRDSISAYDGPTLCTVGHAVGPILPDTKESFQRIFLSLMF